MAYCNNCGSQIPNGSRFCPNCGAPMGGGYQQPQYQYQQPQKKSYMDRVREAREKQKQNKVKWYHYVIATALVYLLVQFLG